jgi:TolB-like protein
MVLVLGLGLTLAAQASGRPTGVAVVDFYNLGQELDRRWLGKALADLLITDLSGVDALRVLDREDLARYERELALGDTGLFDEATLVRLGRTAKVDKLLSGVYRVGPGKRLSIQVSLVDIASRRLQRRETVEGDLDQFFQLQKRLSRQLISKLGVKLSDKEIDALSELPTQSLDAAAHFYTAIGHYDRGELEYALAESRLAQRIDPRYMPARYWVGRLFSELGEYGHAGIELDALLDASTGKAYPLHAGLLLAQIYQRELDAPGKAIGILESLQRTPPDSLEQLNLHFRLARAYAAKRRFDQAYALFLDLAEHEKRLSKQAAERIPYKSVTLLSAYDIKKLAREDYQSAFLNGFYHSDVELSAAPEMILLTPGQPGYKHTETTGKQGFHYGPTDATPMFYVPKGMRFKAFTLEFQGPQKKISIYPRVHHTRDFSLRGQKRNLPDPEGGRSSFRYDCSQELIRAVNFDGYIQEGQGDRFSWSIRAEFMPEDAPQPGSTQMWHDLLQANTQFPVLLETPGHNGAATSLLEARSGALLAAYDTRRDIDKTGVDSELWLFHFNDKQRWSGPARIAGVNSVAHDFGPDLHQDGQGRLLLTFVSDRRGENELWLATSGDGRRWSRARRLSITSTDGKALTGLSSPRLFQDRNGLFRLGFYHVPTARVMVSASHNLMQWDAAAPLAYEPPKQWNENVAIDYFEDRNGRLRLVASPNFGYQAPPMFATSLDGENWQIRMTDMKASSYPAAIHDQSGRFTLLVSTDGEGLHYLHQLQSPDWKTWSEPLLLPRIHYLADAHMARADLIQDREGYYWIAAHQGYKNQFQLFRLPRFPVDRIGDTFIATNEAVRPARYQLAREEEKYKAFRNGDRELGRCLSRAMRYETCFKRGAR